MNGGSKLDKYKILTQHFGYKEFRDGQAELIDNIIKGRDVVGIMPTGAGKSMCYQVPALIMNGITIIISPLISLMKDQVQSLIENGIPAAYINSTLTMRQTSKAFENATNGKYKLMYVAPERLGTKEFLSFAQHAHISMIAVDEAHCVSHWGQNFRPSYLKIRTFIDRLQARPVISAFTATATREVKEDILKILKLNGPYIQTSGFDRSNLFFEVRKPRDKYKEVVSCLQGYRKKSGIIYCSTRKAVEKVCAALNQDGYAATRYHAGLPEPERAMNQEDFLYDRKMIMVATNAFGMGIDKSNVSYVIHYNMPKDIESYYQEAGRAGRDGAPASCVLLYSSKDVVTNEFLINQHRESSEHLDDELIAQIKEQERERLKKMTFYCHTQDCLREYILKYFGDQSENFCGYCSNCRTNFEEIDITEDAQKILSCVYRSGQRYGIKLIVDTLRGSKGKKVLQLGLHCVKTYGLMADESEKRIRNIINYLLLQNILMQTNTEYPTIKLTPKARDVLMGEMNLTMKLAKQPLAQIKDTTASDREEIENETLFNALRALRSQLAKEKDVPAFVIFSDATLMDMCEKMPSTDTEFLNVTGVGKIKQQAYSQEFLKVIRAHR